MKKSFTLLAAVTCFVILSQPMSAVADDFDQQIEKTSQAIQAIQSSRTSVANYKAAMEKQITQIQKESTVLLNKKTTKEQEASKLSQKIADLKVVIAKRESVLKEQARSYQIGQGSFNMIETVLNSKSLSDAIENVYAASTIIKASKDIIEDQKRDQEETEKLTKQLNTELKEIDTQTNKLQQKEDELTDLKINQDVRLAELAIELNKTADKKQQLIQQKEQAEKERAAKLALLEQQRQQELAARQEAEAAIQRQREKDAQAAAAESAKQTNDNQGNSNNSNTNSTPNKGSETPVKPVEPSKPAEPSQPEKPVTAPSGSGWNLPLDIPLHISSPFGGREDPTGHSGTQHNGIDFTGAKGTPIYSIAAGTVVAASYTSSTGNHVVIQHDNGYYSYYMHMDTLPAVSVGQRVGAHQYLGPMGTTGPSTGVHLHLGISKGAMWSNFVNPASILGL